ncbi:MAG: hypothetical protein ACREJC_00500 [Tepidisphaeraceae bacterium]
MIIPGRAGVRLSILMRCLRPRMFLLAITTLLLIASIVVWARSYRVADSIVWADWYDGGGKYDARIIRVDSGRGVIGCSIETLRTGLSPLGADATKRLVPSTDHQWATTSAENFALPRDSFWRKIGFGHVAESGAILGIAGTSYTRQTRWGAYWSLALLTGAIPAIEFMAWLLRKHRSARRITRGLCANCGYDLRASTGRCPECGTERHVNHDVTKVIRIN